MSKTLDNVRPSPATSDSSLAVRDDLRLRRGDLMMLTKARLSLLVVVTTFAGYWLGRGRDWNFWQLAHVIFGTLLCAFGAAVFNQLMEIDADARMKRTAGRPLPARRIPPAAAFALGAVLCGWGIVHLANRANVEAAALAAATIFIYIFIYTPLKLRSSLNTLVGGVSGALPPLIGWVGAAGPSLEPGFRWGLLIEPQAMFLFGLLFLWQMPHFLAINWMYREEYLRGGFIMWSNDDETGAKTGALSVFFTALLIPLMLVPALAGFAGHWFTAGGAALTAWLCALAWRFLRSRTRPDARKLFFGTLLYLPAALALLLLFAR